MVVLLELVLEAQHSPVVNKLEPFTQNFNSLYSWYDDGSIKFL